MSILHDLLVRSRDLRSLQSHLVESIVATSESFLLSYFVGFLAIEYRHQDTLVWQDRVARCRDSAAAWASLDGFQDRLRATVICALLDRVHQSLE